MCFSMIPYSLVMADVTTACPVSAGRELWQPITQWFAAAHHVSNSLSSWYSLVLKWKTDYQYTIQLKLQASLDIAFYVNREDDDREDDFDLGSYQSPDLCECRWKTWVKIKRNIILSIGRYSSIRFPTSLKWPKLKKSSFAVFFFNRYDHQTSAYNIWAAGEMTGIER